MRYADHMNGEARAELSKEEIDRLRARDALPILPVIYLEIASVIGMDAALRLARYMSGQKVEFTANPQPTSMLPLFLTFEQIAALHRHFMADQVKLISAWPYLNLLDARAMRADGKSIPFIARTLRIAVSTAEHYVKNIPMGSPNNEAINKIKLRLDKGDDPREICLSTGYRLSDIKKILRSSTAISRMTYKLNRKWNN